MANTTIFKIDYRSPPSGDGVIHTSCGKKILLTSDGNAMGHPDYFTEIRHFPKDHANGGDDLRFWTYWLRFIFQELGVEKIHDSEFNYEGDKTHLIEEDGYIKPQVWLETILTYA